MKNMKIGKKLIIAFIAVTVLASVSGIIGLFVSQDIEHDYKEALVVNGFSQGDIGRFDTYINKGSALVRDMIFLTDQTELETVRRELDSLKQKTDESFAALKVYCQTPQELEQVAVIAENLPKYQEKREQVITLGLQNKNDEALAKFRGEARPLLNACTDAADALAELNVNMGNQVSDKLSAQSRVSTVAILATVITTFVIALMLGAWIARLISRPVQEIEEAASKMAEGNLDIMVTYRSRDELGSLADKMRHLTETLKTIISDEDHLLGEMAKGNFDLNTQHESAYVGHFQSLLTSMRGINVSLSDTLAQINQSADQVAGGSDQVSSGAQALSQGATEQASSVQELAATINEISAQVQNTAKNALDARTQTTQAGEAMTACNQQMQDMISAMEEISRKSTEIGKIIKTIEDIAFQTNILALNAAVEAARAGAAGKGFAVVADEVRNLASKSADASKDTSALIEGSIKAVEEGTRIASETAQSLLQVMQGAQTTSATVGEIAKAAGEQAESISQITQGIDQISAVVQTNSATAEESAAASEELSSQAQMLKNLVGRFKLKDTGAGRLLPEAPALMRRAEPVSLPMDAAGY